MKCTEIFNENVCVPAAGLVEKEAAFAVAASANIAAAVATAVAIIGKDLHIVMEEGRLLLNSYF